MAYDEGLAERLREILEPRGRIVEKKMFGGIADLARGYMFVGIAGESLMVRVGPEHHEAALSQPHVRPMDFTGKPMKGYVFVDPPGLESDDALSAWVEAGLRFVQALPPKPT